MVKMEIFFFTTKGHSSGDTYSIVLEMIKVYSDYIGDIMKYIISETGEFPPQYKILQESKDGNMETNFWS